MLGWIDLAKTWDAAELKRLLAEARRREPALRVLAHKNGKRTREPADIQVAQKHLLVNAFAAALYMVAKGGPNDGDEYYEPMLARKSAREAGAGGGAAGGCSSAEAVGGGWCCAQLPVTYLGSRLPRSHLKRPVSVPHACLTFRRHSCVALK